MNKAIFLDRDGVINEEKNYICKIEDIKILENVPESLKLLKQKNFKLIVISNQPVIARGLASEEQVDSINQEINNLIKKESGIEIDKFFFCPHHPNADIEKYRIKCSCRKPNFGLVLKAAEEFDINLSESWMIGDRISDIVAGKNAGCKTILIEREYSKNKIEGATYEVNIKPDFITNDLISAVKQIIPPNKKGLEKAIILSAGLGTRMRELTKKIPKVMLEINGKPLLLHNIEKLKSYGVKEFCINLHYLSDVIKDYFGDGSSFGVKIHYNFEPELLGTSGALISFKHILTDDFFVIYGDIIGNVNIENWVNFHKNKKSDSTLIVHPSSHPEDSDIAQLNDDAKITNLIKKPGNRNFGIMGNAAWYIVSPKIFDFIPEGNSDFVKDVFPKMIKKGMNLYGYNTDEFISDVGTPERFQKAEKYFKNL